MSDIILKGILDVWKYCSITFIFFYGADYIIRHSVNLFYYIASLFSNPNWWHEIKRFVNISSINFLCIVFRWLWRLSEGEQLSYRKMAILDSFLVYAAILFLHTFRFVENIFWMWRLSGLLNIPASFSVVVLASLLLWGHIRALCSSLRPQLLRRCLHFNFFMSQWAVLVVK